MSRRFGRNQRRRAREALAAEQARAAQLEGALKLDRAMLAHLRGRIKEAEDFQREVADIVGRQSIIAGSPVNIDLGKTKSREADGWRLTPFMPMSHLSFAEASARSQDIHEIRYEILRLLDIELVAEPLRRQMQAWVRIAGAEVCYGMTEEAFRGMTDQDLMRQLVGPIARQLALELKGRFR